MEIDLGEGVKREWTGFKLREFIVGEKFQSIVALISKEEKIKKV